jgi:hypothetical protein
VLVRLEIKKKRKVIFSEDYLSERAFLEKLYDSVHQLLLKDEEISIYTDGVKYELIPSYEITIIRGRKLLVSIWVAGVGQKEKELHNLMTDTVQEGDLVYVDGKRIDVQLSLL